MDINKELDDGKIKIKERTYEIYENQLITISLFKMFGNSLLIWIGKNDDISKTKLSNLCLSINGVSTQIIGNQNNSLFINNLSIRICKKFNQNKPTYVSYNLNDSKYDDQQFLIKIEQLINLFFQ